MSTLASQGKLTDLANKFDGKTPVRVHFLDNSSKVFLSGRDTLIKDIVLQCLTKVGVTDPSSSLPYFCLCESRNGSSIDGALDMEQGVGEVLQGWTEAQAATAKFLFMIRLYMPCIWGLQLKDVVAHRLNRPINAVPLDVYFNEAELVDSACLHLQFIQAVYNVITGRYPSTFEEALDLGAIHFIHTFGFNPQVHKGGFLGNRIVEFIPIKHLRGGTSVSEWEDTLLGRVKDYYTAATASTASTASTSSTASVSAQEDCKDSSEGDGGGYGDEVGERDKGGEGTVYFRRNGRPLPPQRKYMEVVYGMTPMYGCSFFRCTQHSSRALPDTVQLGVHRLGLGIFDRNKKLVRMFHIEDIFRWGFKPCQMFYFEIAEDQELGTSSLEFDTVEGKVVSDLLTDYAMAFLREREREDERHDAMTNTTNTTAEKGGAGAAGGVTSEMQGMQLSESDHGANGGGGGGNKSRPPSLPSAAAPPRPPSVPARDSSTAEDKAAVRLQAQYRGFALRNEWAREDAAILMQSIYRGYRARVLLSEMIEAMILEGQLG